MLTLLEIKRHLREGEFTSVGGYPKYFVACDGSPLSFDWVRDNWANVVNDYVGLKHPSIAVVDINWEDCDLVCEGSGQRIPSAYAEGEAESAM